MRGKGGKTSGKLAKFITCKMGLQISYCYCFEMFQILEGVMYLPFRSFFLVDLIKFLHFRTDFIENMAQFLHFGLISINQAFTSC